MSKAFIRSILQTTLHIGFHACVDISKISILVRLVTKVYIGPKGIGVVLFILIISFFNVISL